MHGRGCAWQGACIARRYVWQGACLWGGMHGRGCAWQGCGRGHAWQNVSVAGGMCGRRVGYCSGPYASYWNAFLFHRFSLCLSSLLFKFTGRKSGSESSSRYFYHEPAAVYRINDKRHNTFFGDEKYGGPPCDGYRIKVEPFWDFGPQQEKESEERRKEKEARSVECHIHYQQLSDNKCEWSVNMNL